MAVVLDMLSCKMQARYVRVRPVLKIFLQMFESAMNSIFRLLRASVGIR